jgi:uncharacterized protein (TIGR03382 family)
VYGFTNFNVQVDNPTLVVAPGPATLALPALLLACARRRRR